MARTGQSISRSAVLDKFNQAAAEGKLPNAVAAKQKEQAKIEAQQVEEASQQGQLPQTVAPELQPQEQAIPAEALTQAPQQVPTPQAPELTDLTGKTKLAAAQLEADLAARKAERRVAQEEAAVEGLFGEISTEAEFRRQKEIEQGLDEKLAILNNLTTQQIQNDLLGARDLQLIEAGSIGTRMSPGNLQRRLSVKERENSIRALGIAAQAAQAQGNVQMAQNYIDSAVEAKYEPLKAELDMRKWMLGRADKFAEGKQKEKFQLQMKDIEKQEREIAEVTNLSQNVIKNGAPQRIIDEVLGLPEDATRDQLLAIPGIQPYLMSQGERLDLQLKRTNLASASLKLQEARRTLATANMDNPEENKLVKARYQDEIDALESLKGDTKSIAASAGRFRKAGPFRVDEAMDWRAGINTVLAGLTLDELGRVKAEGVTFGQLSNDERKAVGSAASALNSAMILDKQGQPTGKFRMSEEMVEKQIDTILKYKKIDFEELTGQSIEDFRKSQNPADTYVDQIDATLQESGLYGDYLTTQ